MFSTEGKSYTKGELKALPTDPAIGYKIKAKTIAERDAALGLHAAGNPAEGRGALPAGVDRVGAGIIDERAARFSGRERRIAELLAHEGREVRAVPTAAYPTPDAYVDGRPMEWKALDPGASAVTVRNALNRGKKQAEDVFIDARGSGLSRQQALDGVRRFVASPYNRLAAIRIVGDFTPDVRWAEEVQ